MSKREWKPGDVTLVEAGCWANRKVALRLAEGWSHENGVNVDGDGVVSVVRPLVVIDPEDREAVERFREIASRWSDQVPYSDMREAGDMDHTDAMQAALREFANPKPPRPDEPRGLGAVVEDADGTKWLRHDSVATHRRWLNTDDCETRHRAWEDLDVVRILSEGVIQ